MNNIQAIDGAANCSFSIYSIPDDIFKTLFPNRRQDVEFVEDVVERLGVQRAGELMKGTWNSRLPKAKVNGIHGTLFLGMTHRTECTRINWKAIWTTPQFRKQFRKHG